MFKHKYKIGDEVQLKKPIKGHIFDDYTKHLGQKAVIIELLDESAEITGFNSERFEYKIEWRDETSSSIAQRNIQPYYIQRNK